MTATTPIPTAADVLIPPVGTIARRSRRLSDDDIVRFTGLYQDGTKRVRTYGIDYGWLVRYGWPDAPVATAIERTSTVSVKSSRDLTLATWIRTQGTNCEPAT